MLEKKKSHYNIISTLKTIIILALIYSKLKLINHYFESQQKQNRQFFFSKKKTMKFNSQSTCDGGLISYWSHH